MHGLVIQYDVMKTLMPRTDTSRVKHNHHLLISNTRDGNVDLGSGLFDLFYSIRKVEGFLMCAHCLSPRRLDVWSGFHSLVIQYDVMQTLRTRSDTAPGPVKVGIKIL